MSRQSLTHIAIIAFLLTLWMHENMAPDGVQIWWSIGAGLGAVVTIRTTIAAARAAERPSPRPSSPKREATR